MTWERHLTRLQECLAVFDRAGAAEVCSELIAELRGTDDSCPGSVAGSFLGALRRKRYFDLLERTADAFVQCGERSAKVRRLYAQAQIDQGRPAAALALLQALRSETATSDPGEYAEAQGLIGRAYKQLFVEAGPAATRRRPQYLELSLRAYWEVWDQAVREHLWHGINVVALLARAEREGFYGFSRRDYRALAQLILERLEQETASGKKLAYWDIATAMESCIALGSDQVREWLVRYVDHASGADAFEIASTLRQLVEVWQLDNDREPGATVLPVLRAALLDREGGAVGLSSEQVRSDARIRNPKSLEKLFGPSGFHTYKWYQRGLERCLPLARVETQWQEGFGSGFLMRGRDLEDAWGDATLLLTNSHVVSDEVADSLRPTEATIFFEAASAKLGKEVRVKLGSIRWSSPPDQLDATVVELAEAVPIEPDYELSPVAPDPDAEPKDRLYIIGHPGGRTVSFSLQDNLLLDADDRHLHYRTPTEGGSSGSPVFNRDWRLVGLHHAGDRRMRKLRGKPGFYEANEGIGLMALRREIAGAGGTRSPS